MRTAPESSSPPVVIELAYGAWLWLDERVAGFAVAARRQLGHRLLDATLDALAATADAAFTPRGAPRLASLELANRRLTLARILLRGCRDRRHLSVSQHEHAMRLLDEWGRQLGGWLRRERAGAQHATRAQRT